MHADPVHAVCSIYQQGPAAPGYVIAGASFLLQCHCSNLILIPMTAVWPGLQHLLLVSLLEDGKVWPGQSGVDEGLAAAIQRQYTLEDVLKAADVNCHILVSEERASDPVILGQHCTHAQTHS